jgi:hypothetical protein
MDAGPWIVKCPAQLGRLLETAAQELSSPRLNRKDAELERSTLLACADIFVALTRPTRHEEGLLAVGFSDDALAWLRAEHEDYRGHVADTRGDADAARLLDIVEQIIGSAEPLAA